MSELKIMEFGEKYRIEQGNTGKDGKWYAEKCKKQQWNEQTRTKEFTDKIGNLSLQLGDKPTAEVKLLQLLTDLTGKTYVESHGNTAQSYGAGEQSAPLDDLIPF